MELPQYLREWHEIDLTKLPAAQHIADKPAGPELYRQFYDALEAGQGNVNPAWIARKLSLARLLASRVFEPWQRRHGRSPRILSVGAGTGLQRGMWLELGYDVSLNDCQDKSLVGIHDRFPNAPLLIGDIRQLVISEKYDVVTMLAVDFALDSGELASCLQRLSGTLNESGILVMVCVTSLSLQRLLFELVKRLTGRYSVVPHVFWVWWRTPGALACIAQRANLALEVAYTVPSAETGAVTLRKRPRIMRCWPLFRGSQVGLMFRARS